MRRTRTRNLVRPLLTAFLAVTASGLPAAAFAAPGACCPDKPSPVTPAACCAKHSPARASNGFSAAPTHHSGSRDGHSLPYTPGCGECYAYCCRAPAVPPDSQFVSRTERARPVIDTPTPAPLARADHDTVFHPPKA